MKDRRNKDTSIGARAQRLGFVLGKNAGNLDEADEERPRSTNKWRRRGRRSEDASLAEEKGCCGGEGVGGDARRTVAHEVHRLGVALEDGVAGRRGQ